MRFTGPEHSSKHRDRPNHGREFGLVFALLAVLLAVLFSPSFTAGTVVFANDYSLGMLKAYAVSSLCFSSSPKGVNKENPAIRTF